MSDHDSDRNDGSRRSKVSKAVLKRIDREGGGVGIQTKPTVKVEIETERDQLEQAVRAADQLGAEIESSFARRIVADIPPSRKMVERLADSESVRRIDVYDEPSGMELNVSEGVEATNTDVLHDIGVTGSDTTIGVIDLSFNLENEKYEDQVVGTVGEDNLFTEDDDDFEKGLHGTRSAEVVADMAPDADLVLAPINNGGLGGVLDELEDHENNAWDFVDVATMSLDFKAGRRLDGQDGLSERIDDFTGDRLFVTAAGNEASGNHWDGLFRDTAGNDLMEFDDQGTERFAVTKSFDPDDEDAEDVTGVVHVHWDADWDDDDQNYIVRLYEDEAGNDLIDTFQTTNPYERVEVDEGTPETVYIEIENDDATGFEHFDFFTSHNGQLSFPVSTPERSLVPPATTRDDDTFAVSAVDVSNEFLAGYSSRGPTQDGRQGIDLGGPTHVSLEEGGYGGTSAAAPHVAGGAGILFHLDDVDPHASEIREALFEAGRGIPDTDVGPPADPDDATSVNPDIGFGYLETRVARDILEEVMIALDESWTYDTSSRLQFSKPAAEQDRVYAGGLGKDLFALARADGNEEWTRARDGALSDSSPYLQDGTIYVGSGGGVLYAIDGAGGGVDWFLETESAITSTPTVMDGTVYVGANDGTVSAIDAGNGSPQWNVDVGEAIYSDVAAADGTVFVTTRDGRVVGLNAANGTETWRFETDTELGSSSPAVGNGTVFVAADVVYALDANNGSLEWTQTYGGTAGANPAVDTEAGLVYVGSATGNISALDAGDGDREWQLVVTNPIASSPELADERVIVFSQDGTGRLIDTFVEPGEVIDVAISSDETRSTPVVFENNVYIGRETGHVVAFEGG